MTLTSLAFPSNSLHLSPTSKLTIFSSPNHAFTPHACPLPRTTLVSKCVPTRHRNNLGPKKTHKKNSSSSEAEELVHPVLRNFREKKPLVTTLDKYAKFLRTEHCFMLFEELGKNDKWLQCLEFEPCSILLTNYVIRDATRFGVSKQVMRTSPKVNLKLEDTESTLPRQVGLEQLGGC